ncbi:hypothetical protein [Haloechinothrix sp. LS1_15]|uniref:hypothetical protein n=1 Tax=Haloechinothrix sp. LS1_15 TaxID=2652248 RepID=UPI002944E685|nr:hypothetical protein [Haloechinothrix sp. LS1_15]MDV6014125.1 hypothetical protein [Haloechinothrix sp. LS1_15]
MSSANVAGRARRVLLGCLAAVLVLALASAMWSGWRAYELRTHPAAGNAALADPDATSEVIEQVSTALRAAFSYDYANLERTERAIELALTGQAAEDYRERFDRLAEQAEAEEAVRTSTVRSVGVRQLDEERAELLVFLDQQFRSGDGDPRSRAATLDVTAELVEDQWLVAEIEQL